MTHQELEEQKEQSKWLDIVPFLCRSVLEKLVNYTKKQKNYISFILHVAYIYTWRIWSRHDLVWRRVTLSEETILSTNGMTLDGEYSNITYGESEGEQFYSYF